MCLGFNLGWAELRLIFANTYRKFDMEVAEERYVLSPFRGPHSLFSLVLYLVLRALSDRSKTSLSPLTIMLLGHYPH